MDNPQERLEASIWLAAFILGEGSLILTKQRSPLKTQPRLMIYNTEPDLVEAVVSKLRLLGVNPWLTQDKRYRKAGHRPVTQIVVSGHKRLAKLLPLLVPHLVGVKRRKAEVLMALALRRAEKGQARYDDIELGLVEEYARVSSEANTQGAAA